MLWTIVASNWTQNAKKGCKTYNASNAILAYGIFSSASNSPQIKWEKIDALELYLAWSLMLIWNVNIENIKQQPIPFNLV